MGCTPSNSGSNSIRFYSQAQIGKGRTSRVLFVWIIREGSQVNWIAPSLRSALASSANTRHPLDLDIRIFVTQKASNDAPTLTLNEKAPPSSQSPEGIKEGKVGSDDSSATSESTATLVEILRVGGGRAHFAYGRPDLRALIDEELAASDGLKVSVDGESSFLLLHSDQLLTILLGQVSGPSGIAQSVRHVTATSPFSSPSAALRGGPSVTLHTETFGW